jgi:hypothetical protein
MKHGGVDVVLGNLTRRRPGCGIADDEQRAQQRGEDNERDPFVPRHESSSASGGTRTRRESALVALTGAVGFRDLSRDRTIVSAVGSMRPARLAIERYAFHGDLPNS